MNPRLEAAELREVEFARIEVIPNNPKASMNPKGAELG
jgi:hypothetical protein